MANPGGQPQHRAGEALANRTRAATGRSPETRSGRLRTKIATPMSAAQSPVKERPGGDEPARERTQYPDRWASHAPVLLAPYVNQITPPVCISLRIGGVFTTVIPLRGKAISRNKGPLCPLRVSA